MLIASGPNGPIAKRPDAPYTLTDKQSDIWRMIVGSMQPDYFAPSHFPMLSQLCRHVEASDRVAMLLEKVCRGKTLDQVRMASLMALQCAESNIILRLCRQLRLSHQSIYRHESIKQRPVAQMIDSPWDSKYDEKEESDE